MNRVRRRSLSPQNRNRYPGEDSPPELISSHPLGFLLPLEPNPNAEPPVLYSFFPLSPNDTDPTTPKPSSPPTIAPSQTMNPRSSQLFLQSQEASPASGPADSPPVLRRHSITTDSEIRSQGLEALAKLIQETTRAEAAKISRQGFQIRNPPAQVAKQTPKSDSRNIRKSAPSTVGKAMSSKFTASDLFSVAKEIGGNRLLDLVWAAYASYISKEETEGPSRAVRSIGGRSKLEKL